MRDATLDSGAVAGEPGDQSVAAANWTRCPATYARTESAKRRGLAGSHIAPLEQHKRADRDDRGVHDERHERVRVGG